MSAALALLAVLIEAVAGYPEPLLRAIGHPVMWMGRLIGLLDRALNRAGPTRAFSGEVGTGSPQKMRSNKENESEIRFNQIGICSNAGGHDGMHARVPGIVALLILLAMVGGAALIVERTLLLLPFGIVGVALVASSLIAQRSLHDHVARVAAALESGGIVTGRDAVSQIVGRDVAALDEAGVARAAIESLAENFSDGVVAPVFWLAIGGLPGAAIYKAINTADSMIGHRTPRHEQFGWAAARIDDLVNLPASRLTALLITAAAATIPGASPHGAWQAVRRFAFRHRSPNAGYPEAAMAGALGLKLAGPRIYAGVRVDDAFMGDGRRDATAADIRAALALYRHADALLIALLAALAAAILIIPPG